MRACVCGDFADDPRSIVVEFPVDMGAGIRSLDAVSMWEQLALAAFLQRHWSDNQVSGVLRERGDRWGCFGG